MFGYSNKSVSENNAVKELLESSQDVKPWQNIIWAELEWQYILLGEQRLNMETLAVHGT